MIVAIMDHEAKMTGPRRHQIKAYVSLVVHEKFKLLAERHKRSINREAEDLIENAVKDVELPEFPVRLSPPPAVVVPAPRQQTPEEIEAERLQRERLAAEYDPDKMYLYWRNQKGAPRDRAEFRVRTGCKNWGKEWAGVTPELEAQVIVRRDESVIEESEGE